METFRDLHEEDRNDVIYTKEFKAWFGDWENDPKTSSKVVDNQGKPLVVYHGSTSTGISEFKPSKGDGNFGDYKFGDVEVSYFTGSKDIAKGYTWSHKRNEYGDVYDCYLRIINPFVVDASNESALHFPKTESIRRLENGVLDKIIGRLDDDEEDDDLAYCPSLEEMNEDLFYLDYKLTRENGGYIDLIHKGSNNNMFSREDTIAYADDCERVMRAEFSFYNGDDGWLEDVLRQDISERDTISTDDVVRLLLFYNKSINRARPYDGMIVRNVVDTTDMFGGVADDYVVFYPQGVKSASKNNGRFGWVDNIYESED